MGKSEGKPRLLVVDDDESFQKLIRFRLKDRFEITETSSPQEALALTLQVKPDAILLDLMMPTYSGLEVCQTLTSLSFTHMIPVIFVSGEPAARYSEFCEKLGAKGYFQKPIDFDALQARLEEILRRKPPERRAHPRVRLKVPLILRGIDSQARAFELQTFTEDVSVNGCSCGCTATLKVGAIVEVALASDGRPEVVGQARVAYVAWPETPAQRCGFEFLWKPAKWVLS